MLPPDLHKQFQRLLLDLPAWATHKGRERTLACLRNYDLWDHRRTEDDPATCAEHLVRFQSKHGVEPYLQLLADLRDANQGFTEILKQIAALEADIRSRQTPRPPVKWNKPPYRGLLAFDREHAPIFFGRDHESQALYEVIAEARNRFTLVLGASGSGKSSLVRAGLRPLLDKRHPKWLVTVVTPLELADPDASLRAALVQTLKEHDLFEANAIALKDSPRSPSPPSPTSCASNAGCSSSISSKSSSATSKAPTLSTVCSAQSPKNSKYSLRSVRTSFITASPTRRSAAP